MAIVVGTGTTGFNADLKIVYHDIIENQINQEAFTYSMLEKHPVISAGGIQFNFAIQTASFAQTGATAAFSSPTSAYAGLTAVPRPGVTPMAQATSYYTQVWSASQTTFDAVAQSRNSEAAFMQAILLETKQVLSGTMKNVNRMLYGNAQPHKIVNPAGGTYYTGSTNLTGVLGLVTNTQTPNSTTSWSNLTLIAGSADPNQFWQGQLCVIGNTYAGAASTSDLLLSTAGLTASRKVVIQDVAVDPTTGQITLTVTPQSGTFDTGTDLGSDNIIVPGQESQGATASTTVTPWNAYQREPLPFDIIGRNGTYTVAGQAPSASTNDTNNTVCNIDPTAATYGSYVGFENRNYNSTSGSQPRALTSGLMNNFCSQYRQQNLGKPPTAIFCSNLQANAIYEAQIGVIQLRPVETKGGVSMDLQTWMVGNSAIPIYADMHCKNTTMYFVDFDGVKKAQLEEFGWLSNGFGSSPGGSDWFQNQVFPTAQYRYFGSMFQVVPLRRKAVGKLSDLAVPWSDFVWTP